jgi:uncharacterized protein YutE (UPF0331/DUF86 family)
LVDKFLINRKLERVDNYLKQIRLKKDPGFDLFAKDADLQSIILFNLIQAIQACIDIGAVHPENYILTVKILSFCLKGHRLKFRLNRNLKLSKRI